MKKTILLAILPLVLGMMAFSKFETFTQQQMKIVANGLVESFKWSYTQDSCFTYNSCPRLIEDDSLVFARINLLSVLGRLPDAIHPLTKGPEKREWTDVELQKYYASKKSQDSTYLEWVPWALKNRQLFIPFWNKNRAVQFWEIIDNEAISQNLDYKTRQKLFSEIGNAIAYYKKSITSLNGTTSSNRKVIFDLAAKISPRSKAYQLQSDLCWKKRKSDLTDTNQQLRAKLATIGVQVPIACHDFYSYQFTRYDRTYDYIFALTRWAARHDNGIVTETEISGYKASTLDALVSDGKKLAEITHESLYSYQIKK